MLLQPVEETAHTVSSKANAAAPNTDTGRRLWNVQWDTIAFRKRQGIVKSAAGIMALPVGEKARRR
jgi:hypothetical protein